MRITLHQLKVFKTVAQLSSVTQAARVLHMTQPAVSNILRQLEVKFNCQLTEIIHKKLYLTSAGTILLKCCDDVLQRISDAKNEIELMQGSVSGTMRVAAVTTAKYFMPQLLGAFKKLHPHVHFQLKIANREEIIGRLQANMDDFVVMSQDRKSVV